MNDEDRLTAITKVTLELFKGDDEVAQHWLNHPVLSLCDKRPVEMVHTA